MTHTDRTEAVDVARGIFTALLIVGALTGTIIGLTATPATAGQFVGPALMLTCGLLLVRIAHVRGWVR